MSDQRWLFGPNRRFGMEPVYHTEYKADPKNCKKSIRVGGPKIIAYDLFDAECDGPAKWVARVSYSYEACNTAEWILRREGITHSEALKLTSDGQPFGWDGESVSAPTE